MRFGSLFAGIGGLDLGLERAGMQCAWQVEIDDYCLKVLEKHWPNVPKYGNVCNIEQLPYVDLICGGFPCQSISQAAHRIKRGDGWLWPEFYKIIKIGMPKYVIIENPSALRNKSRGLGIIFRDLAASGYDAEWQVLSASAFGAPHKRARIWVVAYSNSSSESVSKIYDETSILPEHETYDWKNYANILRMDDGITNRLDKLRALGNAVVPQVAEWIGRRIMEYERLLS